MAGYIVNETKCVSDEFTIASYRQLVRLSLQKYPQASYRSIPWGERFILWRHDVDLSLNRALVLAQLEAEEGLRSTYFINPHSEFYNLLQADQASLVREIIGLGHDVGLHFDAGFYGEIADRKLHELLVREASWLNQMFGSLPSAFSFHNPLASHLKLEDESYGGLINCYSRRFKTEVAYCSDSNGYWRFRSLREVLDTADDHCIQVLTHPGWWQDEFMPPRQRVFRCAFGRAHSTMRLYDQVMEVHGRANLVGLACNLDVLKTSWPDSYQLCDYLWNTGKVNALLLELWRLHQSQIRQLCKAVFHTIWLVPAEEIDGFFAQEGLKLDGYILLRALFQCFGEESFRRDWDKYQRWASVRDELILSGSSVSSPFMESGCVFLSDAINRLRIWGLAQSIAYDGLAQLQASGKPIVEMVDGISSNRLGEVAGESPAFPKRRWEEFKASLGGVTPMAPGDN